MHIEIHIFPDSFPIDPNSWSSEMDKLAVRIHRVVMDGTVNSKAYAMGKTTLLALDDATNCGMIVATVDIRKGGG